MKMTPDESFLYQLSNKNFSSENMLLLRHGKENSYIIFLIHLMQKKKY